MAHQTSHLLTVSVDMKCMMEALWNPKLWKPYEIVCIQSNTFARPLQPHYAKPVEALEIGRQQAVCKIPFFGLWSHVGSNSPPRAAILPRGSVELPQAALPFHAVTKSEELLHMPWHELEVYPSRRCLTYAQTYTGCELERLPIYSFSIKHRWQSNQSTHRKRPGLQTCFR